MYEMLQAKNSGLEGDLVEFAVKLVRTPSPSLEESDVAQIVRQQMDGVGFDQVLTDEAGNVVGTVTGREAQPTVLLVSHMDTVSPGAEEAVPAGEVRQGRLYGVGSADCKGGLAAQVFAAKLLKRSLLPLRGNLVVAAAVAEENGASVGVRTLIEKTLPGLGLKPDFAILGEPTGLGLYYGHDGWVEVDVHVLASSPFLVDHVAGNLFRAFDSQRFADHGPGEQSRTEEFTVRPPRFDEHEGLSRGIVQLSRRLRGSQTADEAVGQIKHEAEVLAQPSGQVQVGVSVAHQRQRLYTGMKTVVHRITHAWATDPFDPLLERARQVLAAAGCPAKPGKWKLGRLGMGTAGGVLVNELGIPTIGYGPGEEAQAHAAGEYVEVNKLAQAAYGTAAMVHGLIGIPVYGWTSDEI